MNLNEAKEEKWDQVIEPPKRIIKFNFKELLQYKYLIFLFVKRDFQAAYKQTVLGPLWFIIQPIMTSGIYTIVFSGIAKIPTDGVPPILFYLSGSVLWSFFTTIFTANSGILASNAGLFSKVYFPRLAVPIATSVSKLYNLAVQFILFLIVYFVYVFSGAILTANVYILYFPIALLQLSLLGLGLGFWASAWTVKYRDLGHLIGFGVGLWMYATPIIYPLSYVTNDALRMLNWLNPVSQAVETFRYSFTGAGMAPDLGWIAYSWAFSIVIFLIGLGFFNKAERTYVDVV